MSPRESHFREQFTITFLATWCARNYADACSRGEQRRLEEPPVEDAQYLAGKAWEELQRVGE